MAASGDITIAQDGLANTKLHPYLVALVRWCMSCVWSTATVLLHRLLAGSLQPPSIAGFTVAKPAQKIRVASKEHLHPEPKVECQVLHAPETHSLDVIFVHGLYGSLGNTWRQGDWRSKYKIDPNIVPLLRPTTCQCDIKTNESECVSNESKCKIYETKCKLNETECKINETKCKINQTKCKISETGCDINGTSYEMNDGYAVKLNEVTCGHVYRGIKAILPNEEDFTAEKFYNNTLLDQVEIVDNFETQANFVRNLFENETGICEELQFECKLNEVCCKLNEVGCKLNEVGCKTNEVCKCKMDREREVEAELDSKVNEVDCECKVSEGRQCMVGCGCVCDDCYSTCWPRDWIKEDYPEARVISINYTSDPYLWRPLWIKECKRLRLHERAEQMTKQLLELGVGEKPVIWVGHSKGGLFIKQIYCEAYEAYIKKGITPVDINGSVKDINTETVNRNVEHCSLNAKTSDTRVKEDSDLIGKNIDKYSGEEWHGLMLNRGENDESSSNCEGDEYARRQASLWRRSAGFMFYSVPHRGSPLADIKTPITARSIELLEISKDSSLVLSLQDRWLKATEALQPQVRSLVETCRTLMSVLWLRIVSVPSADAGIGALYGVSVDHREICKPSSRRCLLYKELIALMRASLNQCRCEV